MQIAHDEISQAAWTLTAPSRSFERVYKERRGDMDVKASTPCAACGEPIGYTGYRLGYDQLKNEIVFHAEGADCEDEKAGNPGETQKTNAD